MTTILRELLSTDEQRAFIERHGYTLRFIGPTKAEVYAEVFGEYRAAQLDLTAFAPDPVALSAVWASFIRQLEHDLQATALDDLAKAREAYAAISTALGVDRTGDLGTRPATLPRILAEIRALRDPYREREPTSFFEHEAARAEAAIDAAERGDLRPGELVQEGARSYVRKPDGGAR